MSERDLFLAALDVPEAERASYLQSHCGEHPELRRRVERLLRAHAKLGPFLADDTNVQPLPPETLRLPGVSTDHPGQVIAGRFKLLELIGEGGMGLVWMAEQLSPVRRPVALKLIKPGMDSQQVLTRFEREQQALALMDHPHIAKVHEGGVTSDGRPYFVMELVRGQALTTYCDEKQLPFPARLDLFSQVCLAVQHAHQKGVLHRDLKPTNILVTEHDGQPVVKVIDFGLAKALEAPLSEDTLYTSFGTVVGTPTYMAPEQVAFNARDIDTRADLYALGVILYELLTGTTPLEKERCRGGNWDEVRRIIREEDPPRPSTRLSSGAARRGWLNEEPARLSRRVQGDLDWIVMRALEKDRERRYDSAGSLLKDVQRYLAHEPVSAGPPSALYRIRKFVRRHRGPVAAGVVAALLLFAGVLGTSWGWFTAVQQAEQAETARGDAQRQRARAEEERDTALAVSTFLTRDLLGQAALRNQPLAAGERRGKLQVRTLLDRAAQELERQFAHKPLTEAALRQTIGQSYLELGEYAAAEPQLLRAVELFTLHRGPNHVETLQTRSRLARLRELQGQLADAEKLHQEVVAAFVLHHGANHPETLAAQRGAARLLLERGRHGEAEKLLRQLYDARQGQEETIDTLADQHDLGVALMHRRQYAEAERLLRAALTGRTRLLGPDHPHTWANENNLALVLKELHRHDVAASMFARLVEVQSRQLGADHPQTLTAQNNLALCQKALGQFKAAEETYQQVLQARTRKLGEDHPATLASKHNLAALYQDQEAYDKADALWQDCLSGCVRKLGATHPHTMVVKGSLARNYQLQGKPAQAESLFREVLQVIQPRLPADDFDVLNAKHGLAQALQDLGRLAEAEQFLRDCLAAPKSWLGPAGGANETWFQAQLGAALLAQQQYAEAAPLLKSSFAQMQKLAVSSTFPAKARTARMRFTATKLINLYEAQQQLDQVTHWRQELQSLQPVPAKR